MGSRDILSALKSGVLAHPLGTPRSYKMTPGKLAKADWLNTVEWMEKHLGKGETLTSVPIISTDPKEPSFTRECRWPCGCKTLEQYRDTIKNSIAGEGVYEEWRKAILCKKHRKRPRS